MKVLLVDVNCKKGSTGKIVYDIFTEANKCGNEAYICYGRGKKICQQNIYKFGLDWETYIHAFLTRITGLTGFFSFFSTKRLISFTRKCKPDVVHIHEMHGYFVNIYKYITYLKKENIPIVWTFHCDFMFTGKCGYAYECRKYLDNCGDCPKVNEYPQSFLFDRSSYMLNKKRKLLEGYEKIYVVTPSEWLANRVKESYLGNKDIVVIRNGIDISNFQYLGESDILKKRIGIQDTDKVCLAVAPEILTNPRKGGHWIIQLATMLPEYKFIVVGAVDEDVEHPDNVKIVKRTNDQKELAEFYSLADIFIICSDMENYPTTCLEAQCCGTEICGFDVGGTKETSVLNTDNFVEYGKIELLKETIVRITKEKKNNKLSNSLVAKSLLSKEIMAKQYMELYEKVI